MSRRSQPPTASRRAFLASGVACLLAGCSADGGDGGTETTTERPTKPRQTTTRTPTATRTPGSTPTAELGDPLTVGDVTVLTERDLAVRHSLLVNGPPVVVNSPENRAFLFTVVDIEDGTPPARGNFALAVGGETVPTQTTFGDAEPDVLSVPGDYPYEPSRGTYHGWLGFEVPAPVPADAPLALTLASGDERGRWKVPDAVVAPARAPPPAFELVSTGAPGSATPGEPFTVEVTLRNTGTGGGMAVIAVEEYLDDSAVARTAFTVPVDPQSTVTVPFQVNALTVEDVTGSQVRVELHTSGGNRRIRVDVATE